LTNDDALTIRLQAKASLVAVHICEVVGTTLISMILRTHFAGSGKSCEAGRKA